MAEIALRILTAAVLIAIGVRLAVKHRAHVGARIAVALMAGLIGYLLAQTFIIKGQKSLFSFLVLTFALANPALIWLLAMALFRERFVPLAWHIVLSIGSIVIGLLFAFDAPSWLIHDAALVRLLDKFFPEVIALALGIMSIIEAQRDARHDLVLPRRQLRIGMMTTIAVYAVAVAIVEVGLGQEQPPRSLEVLHAFGLLMVAGLSGLAIYKHGAALFSVSEPSPHRPDLPDPPDPSTSEPAPDAVDTEVDPLNARLDQWISEGGFIEPGLTVAKLAAQLGTQEHKLRKRLNSELGFRNFRDFLHQHRIREACKRLEAPDADSVSILSLSIDLGYRSLATFNRAFKTITGVNPSEYRKNRSSIPK